MKNWFVLVCAFFIISCKEEQARSTLVLENMSLFDLYDSYCESWIEQKYPCSTDSCFSSAAVEIVGIDTSDAHRYLIYAWSWNEHFLIKNGNAFSGNKKLTISRFAIDPSTRANKILDVYLPNEELPIAEQLAEQGFPENLVENYFTKQAESVEKIRIQALTKKATDKYQLYLSKAYVTQTDIFGDSISSTGDSTQSLQ